MSVYILAEIGINHNNNEQYCHALIDSAARAGCDGVKLQFFKASQLYPRSGGMIDWKDDTKSYSYDIYTAVESFETPLEWIPAIQAHCKELGIELLASVFDIASLHFAVRCGFPRIKLASSVVRHLPLLERSATTGLPCLLSTGGVGLGEIESAVACMMKANPLMARNRALSLLHCSLQYPTLPQHCNLGAIRTLVLAFPDCEIGYSDHSEDATKAPYEAVRLGARCIEKHITLDKKMAGPDHFFALEPHELRDMVVAVRKAEAQKEDGATYIPDAVLYGSTAVMCTENQRYLRNFVSPVLFTHERVAKGERIAPENIAVLRPAKKERGLESDVLPLFGQYAILANSDIEAESSLQWSHVFEPCSKRMQILLRADAHPSVGTGDLASCIALSRHLARRNWDCHFAVRATPDAFALLQSYAVDSTNIHVLADALPLEKEVALTDALVKRLCADAILVQVTDRPLNAYANMDVQCLKACVCFEEEAPRGFDMVWSWDVRAAERYDVSAQPQTRFFLGAEYVILPPEFSDIAVKRTRAIPPKRLLVVMGGGADTGDVTGAVARKLVEIGNSLHATFVLGSGYRYESKLRAVLNTASFPFEIKSRVSNMLEEYLACDMCIAAGGLTASELAFTKTPALLIALCDHQIERCAFFEKRKWARYLGSLPCWTLERDDLSIVEDENFIEFQYKIHEVLDYFDKALNT